MNIDFHWDFLPANFPDLVCDIAHRYHSQISDGPRGSVQISIGGLAVAPHVIALCGLDEKRLTLDRTAIAMQVLSVPPDACCDWADPQVAVKLAHALNDALGRAVQDASERFVGQVLVALQDRAAAVEELIRAVTPLAMIGYPTKTAIVAAHLMYGGRPENLSHAEHCLAHGGGTFSTLLGRMGYGARVRLE
jgi:hypothetical protein